jgi:hypothetical protein
VHWQGAAFRPSHVDIDISSHGDIDIGIAKYGSISINIHGGIGYNYKNTYQM